MQKQHLLMVLFGTNLLSIISNKALKKAPYLMPDYSTFFIKIRCRFNAGGWVGVCSYAPPPLDSFFQQVQKHTISNFRGGGHMPTPLFESAGAYAPYAPRLHTPLDLHFNSGFLLRFFKLLFSH